MKESLARKESIKRWHGFWFWWMNEKKKRNGGKFEFTTRSGQIGPGSRFKLALALKVEKGSGSFVALDDRK